MSKVIFLTLILAVSCAGLKKERKPGVCTVEFENQPYMDSVEVINGKANSGACLAGLCTEKITKYTGDNIFIEGDKDSVPYSGKIGNLKNGVLTLDTNIQKSGDGPGRAVPYKATVTWGELRADVTSGNSTIGYAYTKECDQRAAALGIANLNYNRFVPTMR